MPMRGESTLRAGELGRRSRAAGRLGLLGWTGGRGLWGVQGRRLGSLRRGSGCGRGLW